MKSRYMAAFIVLIILCSSVSAQFSTQIYPGETILKGNSNLFSNVGIYDDALALVAGYRVGVGGYTDLGLRGGYVDAKNGGDDGFMLSGDFRYQVLELRIQDPIDMSVGSLVETVLDQSEGNISVGAFAVGSRAIALTAEKNIVPYGRLIMRWDRYGNNDEFNIGFNIGAFYDVNSTTATSMEFQFDNQFGFIIGLIYRL